MAIVSDEQVIKVLRQYNPWWRNPLAIKEENKPQKRLAYYEALRMISHKTIRRFAVLSGARRVGKTTIMYQMMNSLIDEGVNPKNILYVSFDNPIVKLVNVETVLSIYESLYPIEGTRYIFLDSIYGALGTLDEGHLRQPEGHTAYSDRLGQPDIGKRLDRQRDGAMEHPEDTHHVVL